ncbi:MAG: hypothetical protein WDN69_05315 [Aliidongia sp.]
MMALVRALALKSCSSLKTTAAYCPPRLGESASLKPRAPWQMVHFKARVAPRPDRVGARIAQHLRRDHDAGGDHGRRRRSRAGTEPALRHAGRAADRIPETLELRVGLCRRQPDEADEEREDGEGQW